MACTLGRWTFTTTSLPSGRVARGPGPARQLQEPRLEGGEAQVGRAAQLRRDDRLDLLVGEGRYGVLEFVQLRAPGLRQDVRPARDDLAHLHIGGAELLEHQAELGRRGEIVELVGVPAQEAVRHATEARQRRPGQRDVEPVLHEDLADLGEAEVLHEVAAAGEWQPVQQTPQRLVVASVFKARPIEAEERLGRDEQE